MLSSKTKCNSAKVDASWRGWLCLPFSTAMGRGLLLLLFFCLNCQIDLSKLRNIYIVFKKISQVMFIVQMAKNSSLNFKMYFSQLPNVFIQIAKRQNSNTISFVSHPQKQKDKNIYVVSCFVTWSVIFIIFLNWHHDIAVFKGFNTFHVSL